MKIERPNDVKPGFAMGYLPRGLLTLPTSVKEKEVSETGLERTNVKKKDVVIVVDRDQDRVTGIGIVIDAEDPDPVAVIDIDTKEDIALALETDQEIEKDDLALGTDHVIEIVIVEIEGGHVVEAAIGIENQRAGNRKSTLKNNRNFRLPPSSEFLFYSKFISVFDTKH